MRFGAMNFPIRPVLDEIHAIGSMGFDYLELAMDAPEGHFTVLEKQRDAIVMALDQYGMTLICHLPTFIHTADLTPRIRKASREELLNSLNWAYDLGAEKIVLHPSFVGGLGRHMPELTRRYALESLDAVAALAEGKAGRVCLENLFARLTPLSTPDDFAAIFDRWPRLTMTLDVGHAFIDGNGMGRIFELMHRFANRIQHIHISDNYGRHDDHLAVGDGKIDFRKLIKAIRAIGYDETMTLEIFTPDREDLVRSRSKLQAMLGA